MSATIQQMSDTIVSKLKTQFPDYEVSEFPDKPEKYRFIHPKAAILVILSDRKFSDPIDVNGTKQWNYPIFSISSFTRSIKDTKLNPGAYMILEGVRAALKGLYFDSGHFIITREYFVSIAQGGAYLYNQDFKLKNLQE